MHFTQFFISKYSTKWFSWTCVNLPVSAGLSAPSLCTGSPLSWCDSLSSTVPPSAPTLIKSRRSSTVITIMKLSKNRMSIKAVGMHHICLPCMVFAVLLFSSSATSSLSLWNGETSAWLRANHLQSHILLPWANRAIMNGCRKNANSVEEITLHDAHEQNTSQCKKTKPGQISSNRHDALICGNVLVVLYTPQPHWHHLLFQKPDHI